MKVTKYKTVLELTFYDEVELKPYEKEERLTNIMQCISNIIYYIAISNGVKPTVTLIPIEVQ